MLFAPAVIGRIGIVLRHSIENRSSQLVFLVVLFLIKILFPMIGQNVIEQSVTETSYWNFACKLYSNCFHVN